MRTICVFIVLSMVTAFCGAVSAPLYDPNKPVATIHKPVGTVEYLKDGKDWTKAATATPLISGDKVKTGGNSFVIIKFIENSILRLQENSEITIRGEVTASKEFSKNVYLERGQLGFNVKKKDNEKFEFSTPTSVASIRGTEGLLINGGDSTVLILGAGIVVFTNPISNQSVNVSGGQTAHSFANGTINVKTTTPEELKKLQETSGGGGGGGTGGGSTGGGTSSSGGGFSVGFAVTAPVVKEGQDFEVTVELVQISVPVDTLKAIVSYFALAYKNSAAVTYKEVPATISGKSVKFKIPGTDVVSPSMQVYVIFRTVTGIDLTYPPTDPQSNPMVIPVQSTKTNQLKLEFSDPSGKKKTMVIEY